MQKFGDPYQELMGRILILSHEKKQTKRKRMESLDETPANPLELVEHQESIVDIVRFATVGGAVVPIIRTQFHT